MRACKQAHDNAGYRGEPRTGEGAAVRLRVPDEGETVVDDLIRGPVTFENRLTDDLVIARGDGTPLYNFAVAVDDLEMGITDVIRGDDHLSNTPKQLLVLEALGAEPPRYAHLPLLHGPDGKKLSKRHGAASVQELRDAGYLPAAVRNYLALLGWGTDDDTTILSTEELVERFDDRARRPLLGDLRRAQAALAQRPLHARAAARRVRRGGGRRARARRAMPRRPPTASVCPGLRDRAGEGADAERAVAVDPFSSSRPSTTRRHGRRSWARRRREALEAALEVLRAAEPRRRRRSSASSAVVERLGAKPRDLYQPLRVAITGTTVSPGIFDSLAALGRERSSARSRLRSRRP